MREIVERRTAPAKQGLYDPRFEHDACGVGFVVDLKGRKSHSIVQKAIEVLINLEHRGACGCEKNTGDGAGISVQTPHDFFIAQCGALQINLPQFGHYGVGMVFLPTEAGDREQIELLLESIVNDEGQTVLGWRDVPTDDSMIGPTARASEPVVRQVFIGRSAAVPDDLAFERKLFVIRRRVEKAVKRSDIRQRGLCYISSLSYKTIVYKGMLLAAQLTAFYPDLCDTAFTTALALVHSRFSTNTFPSWARAHPYRYLAHNGEINTLRGNINWMHARESRFSSRLFGEDISKLLPVIDGDGSDSAMFDNALEMLTLAGRPLAHSLMMMIPEPWTGDQFMSAENAPSMNITVPDGALMAQHRLLSPTD
jgi:glutamate synthase (ferredoxin)